MIAFADEQPDDRDRLITKHRYLCSRGARKFQRPGLDRADLEQVAAIGLIKACDRYDSALQTPFEAYAWLFIVGELMHHVRDHERIVRAPRRLRHLERRLLRAHEELVAQFGCEPNNEQLAKHAGIEPAEIHEVRRYREQAVSQSIDALPSGELQTLAYTIEHRDNRIMVDAALARLTVLERKIVLGIYAGGYNQIELAQRLGYSRRHVSRLHNAALKKMRPIWVRSAL